MRPTGNCTPAGKPVSWLFLVLLSLFTLTGQFAVAYSPATSTPVATAQFRMAKTPAKSLNFKRALLHISKKPGFDFPQPLEMARLHNRLFLTALKQLTINNLRPQNLDFYLVNVLKPATAEEPSLF